MTRSALHFILAALLFAATAIFLFAEPHGEILPSRLPLRSFPFQMGAWAGTDVSIGKDVLDTLGPGDFLLRDYRNGDESQPPVDLFVAYFPSQRTGDTIHSPQNCLPGAGWTPIRADRTMLSTPGHPPFAANRYVIAKGDSRQLVLYWYWAHDRGVASEYMAKFYLVADSIRMHRSDGAMIRITTGILPGESTSAAEHRILPFAETVLAVLKSYIPS
jgi:EpsI family protein